MSIFFTRKNIYEYVIKFILYVCLFISYTRIIYVICYIIYIIIVICHFILFYDFILNAINVCITLYYYYIYDQSILYDI